MVDKKNYTFKVCTRCSTFNHSNYIIDTLQGFVLQETSFPVVYAIIDDASTDNTQEIVLNYLFEHFNVDDKDVVEKDVSNDYIMFFCQHKENRNCYFAYYRLKYNHWNTPNGTQRKYAYVSRWEEDADYTAMCEGDDYWVDPFKLQKQVDALEAHPNCSMSSCRTIRISAIDQTLGTTIPLKNHILEGVVTMDDYLEEQFKKGIWTFHTSSYVFNNKILGISSSEQQFFVQKFLPYGDLALVLWALIHGNAYYLDFVGSRYRVSSGGFNHLVRKDKGYALEQTNKLIRALLFFDNYTNGRYHSYIKTRIKHIRYYCEIGQGHHFVFLKPYYWDSYNMVFLKSRVKSFISERFPRFYQRIESLRHR